MTLGQQCIQLHLAVVDTAYRYKLLPHPTLVVPTHVKFAEVLGLVNSDTEKTKPEPAMKTCAPKPDNPEEYTAKDDAENNSPNTVSKYSVDELDLSHVEEKYRNRLRELIRRFSAMWDGSLGEIPTTEHRIDVIPGSKPVSQQPYRAGFREREFLASEIDKMLRAGVIEPAQSAWASPVVIVPKQDGSYRF